MIYYTTGNFPAKEMYKDDNQEATAPRAAALPADDRVLDRCSAG
jgi:hypothetical protein